MMSKAHAFIDPDEDSGICIRRRLPSRPGRRACGGPVYGCGLRKRTFEMRSIHRAIKGGVPEPAPGDNHRLGCCRLVLTRSGHVWAPAAPANEPREVVRAADVSRKVRR